MSSSDSSTPPIPNNLQDVEKELNQAIFFLGRARYERMLAESREHAIADRCALLAKTAHELRGKIQDEVKAAATPNLTVVPGGSDAPQA